MKSIHLLLVATFFTAAFDQPLHASNFEDEFNRKVQASPKLGASKKSKKDTEQKDKKGSKEKAKKADKEDTGTSSGGCFAAIKEWISKPENQEKIKDVAGKVAGGIQERINKPTDANLPETPAPAPTLAQ